LDHGILYDHKVRRHTFKNKKLTKFFIKKLLIKLEIPEQTADKCVKVPAATYAKILDLFHKIVNGKFGFGKLGDLRTLLCDDLRVIPSRLEDPKIFNDVRNFLNEHIKSLN
jgi:hypothetical protein